MTTVHLVYPHGDRISCPDAIGRNLTTGLLARGYEVINYRWDDTQIIRPRRGDVLVGHPHPAAGTIFRRSVRSSQWARVLLIAPFNHDLRQVAFLESVIRDCDLFLAITGNYWFSSVQQSAVAHWAAKMVHVDLAVDPADYPPVKTDFNREGARRFLYVGHSGFSKNVGYLSQIAALMTEVEFGWIGSGRPIRGLTQLGTRDFRMAEAQHLVANYDFLITVGSADANPATILEAMAWGLIPICTRESGYSGYPGIINIPLGDGPGAVDVLRRYLSRSESDLRSIQLANWKMLRSHFNWSRFVKEVAEAIESQTSPSVAPISRIQKLRLKFAELSSPYSPLTPRNVRLAFSELRRLNEPRA